MTDEQIRIECLKIALSRGANDVRPLTEIADEYYAWVYRTSQSAPQTPKQDETSDKPGTAPTHSRKQRRKPDDSGQEPGPQ